MKTFFFISNGCEPLKCDEAEVAHELIQHGIYPSCNPEIADLLIIMGCTFSQKQEDDFHAMIQNACNNRRKGQIILASGCFLRKKDFKGVIYARKNQIFETVDRIHGASRLAQISSSELPFSKRIPFVAISQGCYGQCSYCSIRFVRGRHISRPVSEILLDIKSAFENNGWVKLVGQEIAVYGQDIGTSLPDLIKTIIKNFPDIVIKLGTLGPMGLITMKSDDIEIFADDHIKGNIHIPLQSASDTVLKRMLRGYKVDQFISLLNHLRKIGVKNFSTDLMSGFPYETEHDHESTLKFLEEYKFEFLQVFAFEPRPKTQAASMLQLSRQIKIRRTLELIAMFVKQYIEYSGNEAFRINDILNTNLDIKKEDLLTNEG